MTVVDVTVLGKSSRKQGLACSTSNEAGLAFNGLNRTILLVPAINANRVVICDRWSNITRPGPGSVLQAPTFWSNLSIYIATLNKFSMKLTSGMTFEYISS